MPTDDCHDNPEVERTARMLAAAAGLVWDRFQKYPGYYRTYWREEALFALGLHSSQAALPSRTAI